jgi:CheY-like chemotaxis protein
MNQNFFEGHEYLTNSTIPQSLRRILVVDDEAAIRTTMRILLELRHFIVETASSAEEAKVKLKEEVFHLVITDMRMETEFAGFDVIKAARELDFRPIIVVLSASAFPIRSNDDIQASFLKGGDTENLLRNIEALLVEQEPRPNLGHSHHWRAL